MQKRLIRFGVIVGGAAVGAAMTAAAANQTALTITSDGNITPEGAAIAAIISSILMAVDVYLKKRGVYSDTLSNKP